MNHTSLNTSDLFGIYMCCGSSIYGLTVTTASMAIPMAAIDRKFWRFGVHLACFIGDLSVYLWVIRRNILVGTWWRLSNRRVYNIA